MDQITQLQADLGAPVTAFLRDYWMFVLVMVGGIAIAIARGVAGDGGNDGDLGDGDSGDGGD